MWHRQIEWIDPIEAASRLAGLPGLCLLDSAMPHQTLGRYSVLAADPFGVFVARDGIARWNGMAEPGPPLDALRAHLARCACAAIPGLPPFQGGAIGSFAYEFGWSLEERTPPAPSRGDDIHLAFHDIVIAFDHLDKACWLIASGLPASGDARRARAQARMADLLARLARRAPTGPSPAPLGLETYDRPRDVSRPCGARESLHRGRRHLSGQHRPALRGRSAAGRRSVVDLSRPAPGQSGAVLRLSGPGDAAHPLDLARTVPAAAWTPGGDAADQGYDAPLQRSGRRSPRRRDAARLA